MVHNYPTHHHIGDGDFLNLFGHESPRIHSSQIPDVWISSFFSFAADQFRQLKKQQPQTCCFST